VPKKFTTFAFINFYGYMHKKTVAIIEELAKTGGKDLTRQMIDAGALTDDELPRIFTKEELEELNGAKKDKPKKSGILDKISGSIEGIFNLLGLGMSSSKNLPAMRQLRAATIASDLILRMISDFKHGHGMLTHK
jgi:hypothetical protein